jgi:hypothetical protein
VEEAGVDGRLEGAAERGQIQGVRDQECRGGYPLLRLLPGSLDRRWHRVHAPDHVTATSEVKGVLPCPAADVQHVAEDLSGCFLGDELLLRPPIVPRRWLVVVGPFEDLHAERGRVPP